MKVQHVKVQDKLTKRDKKEREREKNDKIDQRFVSTRVRRVSRDDQR